MLTTVLLVVKGGTNIPTLTSTFDSFDVVVVVGVVTISIPTAFSVVAAVLVTFVVVVCVVVALVDVVVIVIMEVIAVVVLIDVVAIVIVEAIVVTRGLLDVCLNSVLNPGMLAVGMVGVPRGRSWFSFHRTESWPLSKRKPGFCRCGTA